MKRRDHTVSVSCLLAAVVFLLIQGAAVAQEFMPPPACYPGTPSLVVGRFYIQGGVTYRNIQTFGFERSTRPVLDPFQPGVPPFGPLQDGAFDAASGLPAAQLYPANPTGNAANSPIISGIWTYNNGNITPVGSIVADPCTGLPIQIIWPNNPFACGGPPLSGLGQYATTSGSPINIGVFTVASPSQQVSTATGLGFPLTDTPTFVSTLAISWTRIMDATVEVAPEAGQQSILYQYNGQQINHDFKEKIWTPSIELGFQWTNFFDMFTAFSWYDMSHTLSRTFTGGTSDLVRRAFTDTFPFSSDNTNNWPVGFWTSDTVTGTANVNNQILPRTAGPLGPPTRKFSLVNFGPSSGVPVDETVNLAADVRVYEWRNGVRSWVPLYGMGRFGITFGPMLSILNWNASEHGIFTFFVPVPIPDDGTIIVPSVFETLDSNRGTLIAWGLFAGADVEVAVNRWFAKFAGQYNLSEQKALANSPYTDTNINLSGFNMTLAGGLRF